MGWDGTEAGLSVAENRTYTEADVAELRKEWERDHQQSVLREGLSRLEGRFDSLPAQMRGIAREVVIEVLSEQRSERAQQTQQETERHWSRVQVVTQMSQLVLTLILTAAGYIAGKGGLP